MATEFKDVSRTQLAGALKMAEAGDISGKIRNLHGQYTLNGAVITVGDTIVGPSIPKNCRVIEAKLHIKSSLGTTGILQLGYKASSSGTIVADPNAFINACDGGGQAALSRMDAGAAGDGLYFAEAVESVVTCTEISTNDDVVIVWDIKYSID